MSRYSHRGYEHRTGSYGRRRRKASGFRKKSGGSAAAKGAAALVTVTAAVVLVYLFADNIKPFMTSLGGSSSVRTDIFDTSTDAAPMGETPDTPTSTGDTPAEIKLADGYFDNADDDIFISNGAGYPVFKGIDTTARNYAAVLNSISRSVSSSVDMYCAVIPTNSEVGLDGAIEGSHSQKQNLDLISSLLSDRVTGVDVYSSLREHRGEYLYFRTDPSLTSLGGYYAYTEIADASWIAPRDVYTIAQLSKKKYSISPFEGEFIARTTDDRAQPHGNQELFNNPDTVEYYKLPVQYNCFAVNRKTGNRVETDLFSDKNAASDPLSVFPGKDTPFLVVYNLQSTNTDKLLIVKDHSAEPVIGYLIPHYSEIYIADVNKFDGDLNSVVTEYGVNDIMFINGIDDANNSLYCQRMRDLFDNSISN